MANDTPPTPQAPALPANYDSNTGTVAANSSAPLTEPVDLTEHVARVGGRTIKPLDTLVQNEETMNQGKADYKNWLYQNSPEEFKKAYPAEYLYRKGYNYVENAITAPATRPLTGKAREEIEPQIRGLAEVGLGAVGAVKPGQAEPVFKQGIALPITEGVGLMPEDIEAVGGRTLPPAPQGGHAGGGVASVEELNRPGRFVKISRSGEPTDQNKSPDFNLKPGEAGYQVTPHGYELKAGQETPATKLAADKYHKEVFGVKTPAAPDYKAIGDKAGIEFRGLQKPIEGVHPGLAYYQDPQSGTSIGVRLDEFSPEKVQEHLDAARKRMAAKPTPETSAQRAPKYQVIDTQTGDIISSHSTAARARLAANKKDLDHGAIRYTIKLQK